MYTTVSDTIRYIGVDDLDLDYFEGQYIIPEGVSYNSYVILDEKIAVMDSVDIRKADEWLGNLKTVLGGRTPDYIVVQHLEPDHAGTLLRFHEAYPATKFVMTAKAQSMVGQFFEGAEFDIMAVKEGDTLALGQHTLTFAMAPMVHWPEVMVTYDSFDKVLFAADGFGKFGAISKYDGDWACEARRYYFNICGKYGQPVQALLKKAAALDIKTICPLHGPVLTGDLTPYIKLYDTWSKYEPENQGVLVAYASFHGGTAAAAELLAEKLRAKGAKKVAVADLCRDDMAETIEDAFRYNAMVVAAPTYDGDLNPLMYDFIHHLQLKTYQKRRVGIVENGTWAPMAGKIMRTMFESMKEIEIVEPMVTIKSRMKQSDEAALDALAEAILA